MDKFDEFNEAFRDFCADENRGDEDLVNKYERQLILAKKAAKNRMIYAA